VNFEYPALLEPGIHIFTIDEFAKRFVEPFPDSVTRKRLLLNFLELLQLLKSSGLKADVWVGGSFLTEKLNPADLDFVVLYSSEGSQFTIEQKGVVDFLLNTEQIRLNYSCDVRILFSTKNESMYWRGVFGFDRQNKPKGFVSFIMR
jgi:hypothetical protein